MAKGLGAYDGTALQILATQLGIPSCIPAGGSGETGSLCGGCHVIIDKPVTQTMIREASGSIETLIQIESGSSETFALPIETTLPK